MAHNSDTHTSTSFFFLVGSSGSRRECAIIIEYIFRHISKAKKGKKSSCKELVLCVVCGGKAHETTFSKMMQYMGKWARMVVAWPCPMKIP